MNIYGGFSPVTPYFGQINNGFQYNYGRPVNAYPQAFGLQGFQPQIQQFQTPFVQNYGVNQNFLSPTKGRVQEAPKQTVQAQQPTVTNNVQQLNQQLSNPRTLFASNHFQSNAFSAPNAYGSHLGGVQRSPLMLSGFLQNPGYQNVYSSPFAQQQQGQFPQQNFQQNLNVVQGQNQVNQVNNITRTNPNQSLNTNFDAAMARSNQTLQNLQNKVSPPKQEKKGSGEVHIQEEKAQYIPQNNNLEAEKVTEQVTEVIQQEINDNINNADVVNNANIHILRYEDGFIYEGDAIDSQRNGFGVLKNEQGHIVYLGSWENDAFHGQGELRNVLIENFTDGFDFHDFGELGEKWEKYEGEFKDNAFHGKGELFLANGERFVGDFFDGKIEGEGVFYDINQDSISGVWRENALVEQK